MIQFCDKRVYSNEEFGLTFGCRHFIFASIGMCIKIFLVFEFAHENLGIWVTNYGWFEAKKEIQGKWTVSNGQENVALVTKKRFPLLCRDEGGKKLEIQLGLNRIIDVTKSTATVVLTFSKSFLYRVNFHPPFWNTLLPNVGHLKIYLMSWILSTKLSKMRL